MIISMHLLFRALKMFKPNRTTPAFIAIASIPFLSACSANIPVESPRAGSETNTNQQDQPQHVKSVTYTGTIVYKNLEGGFFALHTHKGQKYTLKGLQPVYRRDGLIAEVSGVVDETAITFTQYGKLLVVKSVVIIDESHADAAKSQHK
ncbi:MAG: hypothetical protein CL589_17050 [Alteromonadaceae bacterium]|nr:hypothetical protein [Alteromonadaceae bacterium]